MLEWIHGKQASAARLIGSQSWKIFSAQDLDRKSLDVIDLRPKSVVPFGIITQLDLLKKSKKTSSLRLHFLGFLLLIVFSFINTISTSPIWDLPLIFWASWNTISLIEWLFLKKDITSDKCILRFDWGMLKVPSIVWQLGASAKTSLTFISTLVVLISLLIMIRLHGFHLLDPAILAIWIRIIFALSPFHSSAGNNFFSHLVKVENKLYLQDHILLSLVLPHRKSLDAKIPLNAWTWITLGILYLLFSTYSFSLVADQIFTDSSISTLTIRTIVNISGFFVSLSIFILILQFVNRNAFLRRNAFAKSLHPSTENLQNWANHSALLTHFPELKNADWKWMFQPTGSLIVEQGESDRKLYWMASGTARVVHLDNQNRLKSLAELHAGSGFGERTFLHGGLRNADVFMDQGGVVASLDGNALQWTSMQEDRFEKFVRASQRMDSSKMFQQLPSSEKELWLQNAKIMHASRGTCIIQEGVNDTWMGMIVDGDSLIVSRKGQLAAKLCVGDVFGEMSLWTKQPRSANLVAQGEITYLRWEADFWEAQARKSGMHSYFDKLVKERLEDLTHLSRT